MADKNIEGSQSARGSQPQAGAAAAQSASASPSAQPGQATPSTQGARDQQVGRGSGAMQRRSSGALAGAFAASPFSLMRRMMEDLDRMFEDFGSARGAGGDVPSLGGRGGFATDFTPAVEMFERDGQLVIRADLPGISPDDVRIEVSDDALVIEGERRSEIEVEDEGVYRAERTYGRFSRVIALPDDVDATQAQARFDNGVLEISIPLPEQTQRRRIPIQGAASGRDQQQPGTTGPVH